MKKLACGLILATAFSCGLEGLDATGDGDGVTQGTVRRPKPTDAGAADAGTSVDAGTSATDAGTLDAGTSNDNGGIASEPCVSSTCTAVEHHNLIVAYDTKSEIGTAYKTAAFAIGFAPTPTPTPRAVIIDGVYYYHAILHFFGSTAELEVWVAPALNQYYANFGGVRGPLPITGFPDGFFLPDDFTLEKLSAFSQSAEL